MTLTPGGARELLPCPFCGKSPKYEHRNSFHQIQCTQRGCVIVEVCEDIYEEAAKRWNARSPDSKLEAYRKVLEFYATGGGTGSIEGIASGDVDLARASEALTEDCGDIARKALAAGG